MSILKRLKDWTAAHRAEQLTLTRNEIIVLLAEHDELLAALKVVCDVHDEKIYNPEWIGIVRAARAKAEGRE